MTIASAVIAALSIEVLNWREKMRLATKTIKLHLSISGPHLEKGLWLKTTMSSCLEPQANSFWSNPLSLRMARWPTSSCPFLFLNLGGVVTRTLVFSFEPSRRSQPPNHNAAETVG